MQQTTLGTHTDTMTQHVSQHRGVKKEKLSKNQLKPDY
jgi:hypothetical protein